VVVSLLQESEALDLVNFDAVPMPDLALVGERALDLARRLAKVPRPAIAYNKAAVNNAQEVAGIISSMFVSFERKPATLLNGRHLCYPEHALAPAMA